MRRAGSGGVGQECGGKARATFFFRILQSAFCIALLGVATTRGADTDGNAPAAKGLLSGLFHEKPRTQAKKDKKTREALPPPVNPVESPEAERERHKNALFRRMEVCDRLRAIANQTGNEALMNQATELEERANALYRQQTAHLPLAAQAPLSVLAADREEPGRERPGAVATAPTLFPDDRTADNNRRPARSSPAQLGGSVDQREQAILNGTSMRED